MTSEVREIASARERESAFGVAQEEGETPIAGLTRPAPLKIVDSGRGAAAPLAEHSFLRFYGLDENPFADSVNPKFFYKTDNHVQAWRQMLLAIDLDMSLAMVTGPSGTGKTLISQLILQSVNAQKHQPILVLVSPRLSPTGLLRDILSELDVALPAGISHTRDLLKLLSNAIIDLHGAGRKLVLLIDECHFLSADNLHILRTISNIEIPERKLSTCLMFAESRFVQRLQNTSYDSLRNRMYLTSELLPMNAQDCEQCVKFRLLMAGRRDDLFDADAMRALHERSGGIARNLNKLCLLTLLEGSARNLAAPGADVVNHCADRM